MRNQIWVWGLLAAGCVAAPPSQSPSGPSANVGERTAALGEPNGDYPNYDERVVLYATNRARTDPAMAGWSSYPAQPPLQWNYQLNESSRQHSTDMRDTPCFQHNSCNGTDVFKRIESYYTASWNNIGENISAGVADGTTAVYNWLYEIGASPGETGHRDNIFSPDFTLLGAGFAAGGSQYTNYWTQDFIGTSVTRPHLTDGIHFPKTGTKLTFGATYYDAGGAAASRVEVIIDGACNPLAKLRGTAANATYEAQLTVASGCHAYYFRSTTGGVDATYPDTGSLEFGGTSCPLFATGHATPTCDGQSGGQDAGSTTGGQDAGSTTGGRDGGTTGGEDAGNPGTGGGGGGGGGGGNDPGTTVNGGCHMGGDAPLAGAWIVLGLFVALGARRRASRAR